MTKQNIYLSDIRPAVLLLINFITQLPFEFFFASIVFIIPKGPGSNFGRDIMPRVSAMLGHSMVSEVSQILSSSDNATEPCRYQRSVYAGDIIQQVENLETLQILTIRCSSFRPVEMVNKENSNAAVEKIDEKSLNEPFNASPQVKNLGQRLSESKRPELGSAKIVVSGGRAFKSAEEFEIVYQLGDELNAAVGASRAAVDSGIAPNDMQVFSKRFMVVHIKKDRLQILEKMQ